MPHWTSIQGLPPRPIVIVEDHIYHIDRILELLVHRFAEVLTQVTVVCLDRIGPDTDRAVECWRDRYPGLQVVARSHFLAPEARLDEKTLQSVGDYQRSVAALLRAGGLLLSDIQLETLEFVSRDQWCESIYLANGVRGSFTGASPKCVFMSNKRGFSATFGRDLLEVGFDPRDVLNKDEFDSTLEPLLRRSMSDSFPCALKCNDISHPLWVGREEIPQDALWKQLDLDLVLWPAKSGRVRLSGRALSGDSIELGSDSPEALTWSALLHDHHNNGLGVAVHEVGQRLVENNASRAEQSNAAAKHIYALRKRLQDGKSISTIEHCYRLDEDLTVGLVDLRSDSV